MMRIDKRITFIHVQKSAGTSVKEWAREQYEVEESFNPHYPWQQLPENWKDNMFAIVRNPYSRLWSWYNFLIKKMLKKVKVDPLLIKPQLTELNLGFEHYCTNHLDSLWHKKRKDKHHNRNHDFMSLDEQLRNFPGKILRYENLEEDFQIIKKELGSKHNLKVKNQNKGYQRDNWHKQYNRKTFDLINERYKNDFEEYGYEML